MTKNDNKYNCGGVVVCHKIENIDHYNESLIIREVQLVGYKLYKLQISNEYLKRKNVLNGRVWFCYAFLSLCIIRTSKNTQCLLCKKSAFVHI